MPMPAARVTDQVLQQAPHCHAPIHPPAPMPTPVPHPALPLMLIPPGRAHGAHRQHAGGA